MKDWIRKALTRVPDEEPNKRLVLGVKFAIAMTVCLTVLEVAHMVFLGKWNSEIFAAITGLSGTVMGVFIGQKT
jgi:hypothetical protein